MISALNLIVKHGKKLNQLTRSMKSVELRIVRVAKAGFNEVTLRTGSKSRDDVLKALLEAGYDATTVPNRLGRPLKDLVHVSWGLKSDDSEEA